MASKRNHSPSHVHLPRKKRRLGLGPVLALTGAVTLLVLAAALPLWLPAALRIVPDRYIAAYAPEAIQEIAFARNPSAQLPTAGPAADEASQLLEQLESTPALAPTQQPTLTPPPDEESAQATPTNAIIQDGTSQAAAEDSPVEARLPSSYYLSGFTHTPQGWNNCAPATITMAMSYWEVGSTQDEAAAFLKPNPEDRNVRPDEVAAYVESLGYSVTVRVNGNIRLIKELITAGLPVMIESGFDPEPDRLGWMGHYILLTGYSDDESAFLAKDSNLGPTHSNSYHEFDCFWRPSTRLYIVPHRAEQAALVNAIIGEDMDDSSMYARAAQTAQFEASNAPNDPYSWFNLGSSLVAQGQYGEAATAYDRARELGLPWRMLWYQFGPYEAYYHTGRYEDVIALADDTVRNNVYSEEAYYYEGLARAALGETGDARYLFTLALRYNSHYQAARQAIDSLPTS
ncbi:MAG: C39 family peptidase [Chloroflexota bacterium]